MNKKIIITFFFLTILILPIVVSQQTIDPLLQNFIVKEEIKTRNEIKQHINKIKSDLVVIVKTEGKEFIDGNFHLVKQELKGYVNKMLIKVALVLITSIVLGQGLWYVIKRKIDKKDKRKEILTQMKKTELPSFKIE